MAAPVECDFALIKYSNMATVPIFTTLCGVQEVNPSIVYETQSRRVRDCATPNKPGGQKVKVLGSSWTATATGLTNTAIEGVVRTSLLGKKVNYRIEYYQDDSTDGGKLLGTDAGLAVMTTSNKTLSTEGESSQEFTFEGEGDLTYTAAP